MRMARSGQLYPIARGRAKARRRPAGPPGPRVCGSRLRPARPPHRPAGIPPRCRPATPRSRPSPCHLERQRKIPNSGRPALGSVAAAGRLVGAAAPRVARPGRASVGAGSARRGRRTALLGSRRNAARHPALPALPPVILSASERSPLRAACPGQRSAAGRLVGAAAPRVARPGRASVGAGSARRGRRTALLGSRRNAARHPTLPALPLSS